MILRAVEPDSRSRPDTLTSVPSVTTSTDDGRYDISIWRRHGSTAYATSDHGTDVLIGSQIDFPVGTAVGREPDRAQGCPGHPRDDADSRWSGH
jgi:hypothetical protein